LNEREVTMTEMKMTELAELAVGRADAFCRVNREQFAISWLHNYGAYEGLSCDEERDLDRCVRLACGWPRGCVPLMVPTAESKSFEAMFDEGK